MRVVCIGDLVTDYYYKNDKLIGVNGGMTSHNIIANLAKRKINTAVYGVCGKDEVGIVSIKSLSDLGVDTSNVKILDNIRTRCFHVSYFKKDDKLEFTLKKRCPICGEKHWYNDSMIESQEIIKNINQDDILVFDNLNNKNQIIIDSLDNIKVIDLGQYFEFENLKLDEIKNKIYNKFTILNLNERVSNYFIKRFNLSDEIELYKLFSPKLLTITKGDKGANFIYNNEIIKCNLCDKATAVDSTGAGDAFVSSIIYNFIKNKLTFDKSLFSKWYDDSVKLTSRVVSKMGARSHLHSLYKIKKKNGFCTCEDFELSTRKKIKRCNININNLEVRIENALKSDVYKRIDEVGFNEREAYAFIGTGGSYAAALFASKIVNNKLGANTYAFYPRNFKYRNNDNIDKVILFSYSGTTNDIISSVKDVPKEKIYLITKGDVKSIVTKTGLLKSNIFSYKTSTNKSKERGFLSFEGVMSPIAIKLKYFYKDLDIIKFLSERIEYWNSFFANSKKIITEIFRKDNVINIFTGDFTSCAGADIESKILESGVASCILQEKKNFSHGRFINYENLNNRYSLYFKDNRKDKYEDVLLNYLDKNKTLIIKSEYENILSEFDLLLASQLLIYYVGKYNDIDVSKPTYTDEDMKLYFYKGSI